MRVDSGGVDVHFDVAGDGRPVVLLHGFPDSGRLWRHLVEPLASAGFTVIVPDLRGYGMSGKPSGADHYSLPLLAGDVLAVLDRLGGPWRYERLEGPGHWMPIEAPAEVSRLLLDFLPA